MPHQQQENLDRNRSLRSPDKKPLFIIIRLLIGVNTSTGISLSEDYSKVSSSLATALPSFHRPISTYQTNSAHRVTTQYPNISNNGTYEWPQSYLDQSSLPYTTSPTNARNRLPASSSLAASKSTYPPDSGASDHPSLGPWRLLTFKLWIMHWQRFGDAPYKYITFFTRRIN